MAKKLHFGKVAAFTGLITLALIAISWVRKKPKNP